MKQSAVVDKQKGEGMNLQKEAQLYRMVMDQHLCPFGLKSKDLLKKNGYKVDDHHPKTRESVDKFKNKHGVETTPQTFIEGKRIGGYDDLRRFFGKKVREKGEKTYQPVVALFMTTFLMAFAAANVAEDQWLSIKTFEWFIAFSMCGLAYLKLRDLESFSTMFLNYDLLSRKWVTYAYIYPFAEGIAGILMIGQWLTFVSVLISLFIGTVGAVSVVKAVYVDGRELKCACVGGDSNVPLGFISLTENLMMVTMGVWMAVKHIL